MLLNNGYSLDFIFKPIDNRIKFLIHKNKKSNNEDELNITSKEKIPYFVVPYYKNISEKFIEIVKK